MPALSLVLRSPVPAPHVSTKLWSLEVSIWTLQQISTTSSFTTCLSLASPQPRLTSINSHINQLQSVCFCLWILKLKTKKKCPRQKRTKKKKTWIGQRIAEIWKQQSHTKLCVCVCVSALPPVVCQVLLQLCYPVELVEEPLVYGRQLVDLINTHATVEGLKSRKGRQICMSHSPPTSSHQPVFTRFSRQF